MFSAIYYPNIQIKNPKIIKTALLLWDRLEYIAPSKNTGQYAETKYLSEALDMIAIEHVPSDNEKKLAHEGILELATSQLPKDFLLRNSNFSDRYSIYPQKFLPETLDALRETELAAPYRDTNFSEWVMSKSIGLAMMSVLAEACAGLELRTVTDKFASYKLLSESIVGLHNGTFDQISDDAERLITISLKVIDASKLNIKRIINFRKREHSSEGTSIRQLRHNYLRKIDSFVKRLATSRDHPNNRKEIERQFEEEIRDDISNLKEALKLKAKDTLLSKEVGVAFLASAGIAVPPLAVPASILGVGALGKKGINYRSDRKEILNKHAMSWLFEMSMGRLKLY